MNKFEKNKKISDSRKITKERRKNQDCKVFETKVDKSHLSNKTLSEIKRLFLEAKWYRNYALSQENVFEVSDKLKEVTVKFKNGFEKRELKIIGSQIKQSVLHGLWQDIKNLSHKKRKGYTVGPLKFKSICNTIELMQLGTGRLNGTHKIKGNKIKIQGIQQYLRVRGLNQIEGYEIANAKFIQKGDDYYFKITCYKNKENKTKEEKSFNPVTTDFGISSQITLSNSVQIKYSVEPTKRLRMLCREFSRKKPHSKNWYKALDKLRKEYLYITNSRKDIKNKILHILKDEFSHIFFQNDCMQGWQRIWGRRMLNTSIGGIIADLRKLEKTSATSVMVDRFFPSTKRCSKCHHVQKVGLDERTFLCKECSFTCNRDLNSTFNIEQEAIIKLKKIGAEYTEFTPAERSAHTEFLDRLNAIPRVTASTLIEAGSPTITG